LTAGAFNMMLLGIGIRLLTAPDKRKSSPGIN
jgi:hypothetical protein